MYKTMNNTSLMLIFVDWSRKTHSEVLFFIVTAIAVACERNEYKNGAKHCRPETNHCRRANCCDGAALCDALSAFQ
jgi:hypothetical protein